MSDKEKLQRIEELVKDMSIDFSLSKQQLYKGMETECTIEEIKEDMWSMFCFISDVHHVLMDELVIGGAEE